MSQDIIADALNMIKNSQKKGNEIVKINKISNLLIEILKIMKQEKAIKKYKIDVKEKSITLSIGDLSECKAIKPRFSCDKNQIEKYRRRYLPARNLGTLIISTNKGLVTHIEAQNENIGGCLIAYFY
ncbi:MAG TPA: 30S ribosomal protein S8 [Candidatus Pacearchaeota archaeon]|nr:30S ribosomal protein S8 [Candidatus Pacearchaeota archaeon]